VDWGGAGIGERQYFFDVCRFLLVAGRRGAKCVTIAATDSVAENGLLNIDQPAFADLGFDIAKQWASMNVKAGFLQILR
jgi:hypothetical protein